MKLVIIFILLNSILSIDSIHLSKKVISIYSFFHLSIHPVYSLENNIFNGEQLFSSNCAACHAGGNNIIYSEKTLRKESLEAYLQGGYSKENIIKQITYGRKAMPPFMDRLNEEEINDIAEYVIDMAENNSW